MKFRLIFSGFFALGALLVNWLVLGDSSPLHEYFLWHGALPNLWAPLNIVPVIGAAVVAGNPHSGSEVIYKILLVIQWFIIGFLLSALARIRPK
jgi:hypothetical protein